MLLRPYCKIFCYVTRWLLPNGPSHRPISSDPPPTWSISPWSDAISTLGDPPLLISALYYDTYRTGEPDEAFQLYNPLETAVDLEAWQVSDRSRTASFPAGINLDAEQNSGAPGRP